MPVATAIMWVAFDALIAALAVRSILILRGKRAPFTILGWVATLGYCIPAGIRFSELVTWRGLILTADGFLVVLIIAFVIAGVRDEPQAEPWYWPERIGLTRAEKRR
jgi:lipoprotein signal peptidase